jgi:hypothetical protein
VWELLLTSTLRVSTPKERYPDARAMAEALLETLPAEEQQTILRMPECNPGRFAG